MSAEQMPSGPNFWDSTRGRSILVGGSTIYGGNVLWRNRQKNIYQGNMLRLERSKGLKKGWINPEQYVLHASEHGLSINQMRKELAAWGGQSKGTNYADPEAFRITENPFNRGERSCTLQTNPVDKGVESQSELASFDTRFDSVPTMRQKGKKASTKSLSLRGGSTEGIEVQERPKNGIDGATSRYNHYTNLAHEVCEVSAEQVQAVPDRIFTRSYTYTTPQEIGPAPYYLFSLVFVITSTYLATYVQKRFLKPAMSNNNILKGLFGEEQELATKARPEFVIETFLAYKRELISKKKAAYILVKYYNLSQVEALELLDD